LIKPPLLICLINSGGFIVPMGTDTAQGKVRIAHLTNSCHGSESKASKLILAMGSAVNINNLPQKGNSDRNPG
jgi:hypothetical protein